MIKILIMFTCIAWVWYLDSDTIEKEKGLNNFEVSDIELQIQKEKFDNEMLKYDLLIKNAKNGK